MYELEYIVIRWYCLVWGLYAGKIPALSGCFSLNILWKKLTLSVIEPAIVLLYAGEDGQGVDGGAGHAGSHTVLEIKSYNSV